jgi:hypothetical protein
MQKVEGSSPFSRFGEVPATRAVPARRAASPSPPLRAFLCSATVSPRKPGAWRTRRAPPRGRSGALPRAARPPSRSRRDPARRRPPLSASLLPSAGGRAGDGALLVGTSGERRDESFHRAMVAALGHPVRRRHPVAGAGQRLGRTVRGNRAARGRAAAPRVRRRARHVAEGCTTGRSSGSGSSSLPQGRAHRSGLAQRRAEARHAEPRARARPPVLRRMRR